MRESDEGEIGGQGAGGCVGVQSPCVRDFCGLREGAKIHKTTFSFDHLAVFGDDERRVVKGVWGEYRLRE
jgi:hypothetical protein